VTRTMNLLKRVNFFLGPPADLAKGPWSGWGDQTKSRQACAYFSWLMTLPRLAGFLMVPSEVKRTEKRRLGRRKCLQEVCER